MVEEKGRVTVGVSDKCNVFIKSLLETEWFDSEMAVFLLSVSIALSYELKVSDKPLSGLTTKFNIGSLDRDGKLRDMVKVIGSAGEKDPYEYAERLAEAGLEFLKVKLIDQGLLLSDILKSEGPVS